MHKIIHFVQNLSLDITAGAVISCMFLAEVMEVEVTNAMLIGLAIAIWLIYTIDHLIDARKVNGEATNPRHAFHQRFFKPILALASLIFIGGLINCFYLPKSTLFLGFGLSIASGLYFLYLKLNKAHRQKELFAALVYTSGIFTAPLSLYQDFNWLVLVLLIQFFLLAYANLLLFPLYEVETDIQEKMNSIVRRKGISYIENLLRSVLGLNMIITTLMTVLTEDYFQIEMIIYSMIFALIMLMSRANFLKKYQLYRILGDGIFFLPGLYLL